MNNILVSVCIATYKRLELLDKLLKSLSNQKINNKIKIEVVVVDNDSLGTAKCIVENYKNTKAFEIKYYVQPIKNISLTRNKCVENSKGEYILFIDDDEFAAHEWVQSMVDTIKYYKADAVFGRVLSYFDEGVPDWIKKNPLFNRKAPPTGTEAFLTRTSNCIVKASILKSIQGPFDPKYGTTGGEDTHLFGKLRKQGAKFVNCFEGWVSEYMPPERSTANYVLKRSFINGNNYTRRQLELAGKKKFFRLIKSVVLSLIFGLTSIFLTIFSLPIKYWRLYWATKIASNWGHLSAAFGYHDQPYK